MAARRIERVDDAWENEIIMIVTSVTGLTGSYQSQNVMIPTPVNPNYSLGFSVTGSSPIVPLHTDSVVVNDTPGFANPEMTSAALNQGLATLAFFGVGVNLVLFLTRVIGQETADAANTVSKWTGTVYLCSLLGAFLSDSYWGRYLTCAIFQLILLLEI
ncbi:hypothetical protein F8388_005295 [Cannabis sativa]|uniref:Uncharacterized protein n=1 Tax=Cannabis sativa TaxID=3483 RepID=A0A7J6ELK2_CANSA|nr:hypothetical protein F8388_005295 [Cannabis sativa]